MTFRYIDDEVVRALHAAIDVLRALGAEVEEVSAPIDFDEVAARVGKVLAAAAYAFHRGEICPNGPTVVWSLRAPATGMA